jgi:diaminohydroxyphosphoribosylaminopyrimidine deaminase/5-amino-6-(5-phosphoribosylamino)uracil reductase
MIGERDHHYMRRAIELAARGFPAPNPQVGCVLVQGDEIVGEGHHEAAGHPHAESVALAMAGPAAEGATAYVTLEPCAHHGRTPPCADALIRAGVSRVVIAVPDPNPKATGGAQRLRGHGIEVEVGVEAEAAERGNAQFLFAMRHRRPRIVIKAACSLDGRIALPSGESQWITGPEARAAGHRLRAECGAVLVGRKTVERDDPLLTARLDGVVNPPLRIVLDPQAKLRGTERVFDSSAPTRHVTGAIDLPDLLAQLFGEGVHGILVEGGAVTISHFVRAGLADRLELFLAPVFLGAGPTWLEDFGLNRLADAARGRIERIQRWGVDVQLSVALSDPGSPSNSSNS